MKKDYSFIFVGGAPRSGTTLVQRILNSHSIIYGGPEFDDLPILVDVFKEMRNISKKREDIYFDELKLQKIFKDLIYKLLAEKPLKDSNKTILSEKTPSNIKVFDDLISFLPNDRYIFVLRDPRAIVNSLEKVKERAIQMDLPVPKMSSNLIERIKTVQEHHKAGFHAVENNRNIFVLRYEDLINKNQETIEKLCSYLGIQFEKNMLNPRKIQKKNLDSPWYSNKKREKKHIQKDRVESFLDELDPNHVEMLNSLFEDNYSYKKFNYNFSDGNKLSILLFKGRFFLDSIIRALRSAVRDYINFFNNR